MLARPIKLCVAICVLVALGLGGCSTATPEAAPTPTAKPAATATQPPADGEPEETPEVEEDAPQVFSEGTEFIATTGGFDLDEGVDPGRMDPTLDFMLRPAGVGELEFFPYAGAVFGFDNTFSEAPDLEQCSDSDTLVHEKQIITASDEQYVCYLTGGNRYGYLRFVEVEEETVTFEWRTFESSASLFPPLSAPPVYFAWVIDQFVPYDSYLDLDNGVAVDEDAGAGDFTVAPGELSKTVVFTPVKPAKFAFDSTYPREPILDDCMSLDDTQMMGDEVTVEPLEVYNVCYRTDEGRYGYIRFTDVSDEGITLDLKTFESAEAYAPTPGAQPTTVAAPEMCEGGELWLDVWPVAIACEPNSQRWTATIFVEGHGANCIYTYMWQGEVQAGPVVGSMTFDVQSEGGTIIGTASVSSGEQVAQGPVYVEKDCP